MEATGLGKFLMILGAVLVVVGVVVFFSDRVPLLRSIGRLPGDLSWKGEGWRIHFPLATSLLLSALLTLVFWAINWFQGRGGR